MKSVVLRVNSPGGSAFASEQINREIQALKAAGKPVVVSMGHLAASGGYWISMNADVIYADFVGKVAEGRDSTAAAIDEIARGRVWSGAQAHDRGLVDELGGLGDALAEAARRAELEEGDYRVRYVEEAPSAFAQFLEGMSSSRVGAMLLGDGALARSLMADAVPELERHLQVFENALENPRGAPIGTVAYCFCTIR